jgi:hypothetical protein
VLIAEAVERYGRGKVIEWAAGLLSDRGLAEGYDITLLGGNAAWDSYWFRVWGARTFLYEWDESAAAAVVGGLADEHWRVREMCAKVCRLRDVAEAGPWLVRLAGDPVERVRLAAIKAIGDICEADSAQPLLALSAGEGREAEAAGMAIRQMERRLDRPIRA